MRSTVAAVLLFVISTATASAQRKPPRVIAVRMTLSSGMCYGYCFVELTVEPGKAMLLNSSADTDKRKCPDLRVTSGLSDKHWKALAALIERDALFALPDRIGCPGCVDEIVESIEVRFSDKRKKGVIYNMGTAPKELSALSSNLRALEEKLQDELPPTTRCR